jgi:opacity protein-like surface antigen
MILTPKNLITFLFTIVLLLQLNSATAKVEISPMVGYRIGGEFNSNITDSSVKFDESDIKGFVLDFDYNKYQQITFLYSQQKSRIRQFTQGAETDSFDVDIDYYQIGGNQIWIKGKMRPFFGVTVGITHLSAENRSSTSKLSFSLGGGSKFFITENLAFMLGVRTYATLMGNGSSLFCGNNGCAVSVSGTGFLQLEANAGVTLRF